MDIVIKLGKFKVIDQHRSRILKINDKVNEDYHEGYNQQNSRMNFLHPSGNDAEQDIEEPSI